MSVKLTTRQVGDVTVVDAVGRITLGEGASTFRDTVRDLASSGHKKILLNLGEVSYIDSSGIGELVFQRLSGLPRVTISRPEAAFYSFFSVDGVNDTMAFCKKLAKEYKVGLAPGEAFAAGGQGNIRLCFASGAEQLSRGLDRIEAAIKAL